MAAVVVVGVVLKPSGGIGDSIRFELAALTTVPVGTVVVGVNVSRNSCRFWGFEYG